MGLSEKIRYPKIQLGNHRAAYVPHCNKKRYPFMGILRFSDYQQCIVAKKKRYNPRKIRYPHVNIHQSSGYSTLPTYKISQM